MLCFYIKLHTHDFVQGDSQKCCLFWKKWTMHWRKFSSPQIQRKQSGPNEKVSKLFDSNVKSDFRNFSFIKMDANEYMVINTMSLHEWALRS